MNDLTSTRASEDTRLTAIRGVVLDTNHLSDLARQSGGSAAVQVIRRLQSGDGMLAVSLFQLLELADPAFKSFDDMCALLDDVPHVLANPFENVQDEEMTLVCARVVGLSRRPPLVWARDTSDWGYYGGPVGGTAVDMLKALRQMDDLRREVREMAALGARISMMKSDAALVRKPLLPLSLALQRHIDSNRVRVSGYADGLSADEIIERVGGKVAFPGYQIQEALVNQRLRDAGQKSTANDIFDEYIAFYAPYAAVTAVDRRTLHRAKMAQLPCVARMTRDLSEVSVLLDRVMSGELRPTPSAG